MERIHKSIGLAIILSEVTHVFCCVLPTVVSILSLFAGMGLISVVPGVLTDVHDVLHAYELPIIAMSGAILLMGWALHMISVRLDCVKEAGCHHEPCAPKKKKTSKLLVFATVLFTMNVTVYTVFHKPFDGAAVVHDVHEDAGHIH